MGRDVPDEAEDLSAVKSEGEDVGARAEEEQLEVKVKVDVLHPAAADRRQLTPAQTRVTAPS